jgi:hypothetical protein
MNLRSLPRRGAVNALTTYELRVPQAFWYNAAKLLSKAVSVIVFVFAFLESKRLLIQEPNK